MNSPSEAIWYYETGQTLLKAGKKDCALIIVGKLMRMEPHHPLALQLLNEIYRSTGDSPARPAA